MARHTISFFHFERVFILQHSDIAHFFSNEGPLSEVISGYSPRQGQVDMAEAVADAIANQRSLIAEAGTGTGKTFAYLAPAILSGKKVIVSTGTKNLQDQLFQKDLLLIRKALSVPFNSALLKGRSNYLCIYRLKNAMNSQYGFEKDDAVALGRIKAWSKTTRSGDVSEVSGVGEGAPVWFQVTSTVDNCLGQDCPDYGDCYLAKARKKAQEAELIVVNHHLLCADWSIRETGFGELLPDAEVIIIDEAHQLADTASNFLGVTLSSKKFADIAEDTMAEFLKDAKDMPELRSACESLQHEIKDLRLAFGLEIRKGEWREIATNAKIMDALETFKLRLQEFTDQLELASVRSKGLESCFNRAEELEQSLEVLLEDQDGKWIRWFETHRNSFTLSRTPLDIAKEFKLFMLQNQATWIFTSATLSVAKRFEHFCNHLGIEKAEAFSWESPFDYANQSLFYHPKGVAFPNDPRFVQSVVEFAEPVLNASRGRAFFLFTSHRALNEAAALLEPRVDYPLLIQGSRPKGRLLEQFKKTPNAILLGTSSFWEGVDVRGDMLSCVIIDKLPFFSPGDPVTKARLNAMQQQGKNPFIDYQLPAAVITLRQGIGRLIRDVSDRGVLMICDPRLLKRSYGRVFLDSVPAMRRTREISDVTNFFEK